ncbi:MAG: hypothetical protein Q9226_000745 [Calogaya cf. arnoldii]
MDRPLTFTTLGYDVLNIIIEMLQHQPPESLRHLNHVSKFWQALVDPVLYRSVAPSDKLHNASTTENVDPIKYRLLDQADSISERVRELSFASATLLNPLRGSPVPNQDMAHRSDLEKIIMRLTSLRSISWDLNIDIPRPIITILEQLRPDVKLSVTVHDRPKTDVSLLATPLLRSLKFNTTPGYPGPYDHWDGYPKMPELKKIMLNTPNLRKLDITFAPYWMNRNAVNPRALQLPLEPTDLLPPLHELILSGPPDTYEWDPQHCKILHQCIDWSQLRLLDLGQSCPGPFIEEFAGSLPSLRSLTMGVRTDEARLSIWRYEDSPTCKTMKPIIPFIDTSYQHTDALRSFSRLVTVRVNLNLNFDASVFVPEYPQDAMGSTPLPPLDVGLARKVTVELFKGFFHYDSSARLEQLEVCFKYTVQYDRGQNYPIDSVFKIIRDRSLGAKSPVDGGFVMEGDGKWRGEKKYDWMHALENPQP